MGFLPKHRRLSHISNFLACLTWPGSSTADLQVEALHPASTSHLIFGVGSITFCDKLILLQQGRKELSSSRRRQTCLPPASSQLELDKIPWLQHVLKLSAADRLQLLSNLQAGLRGFSSSEEFSNWPHWSKECE